MRTEQGVPKKRPKVVSAALVADIDLTTERPTTTATTTVTPRTKARPPAFPPPAHLLHKSKVSAYKGAPWRQTQIYATTDADDDYATTDVDDVAEKWEDAEYCDKPPWEEYDAGRWENADEDEAMQQEPSRSSTWVRGEDDDAARRENPPFDFAATLAAGEQFLKLEEAAEAKLELEFAEAFLFRKEAVEAFEFARRRALLTGTIEPGQGGRSRKTLEFRLARRFASSTCMPLPRALALTSALSYTSLVALVKLPDNDDTGTGAADDDDDDDDNDSPIPADPPPMLQIATAPPPLLQIADGSLRPKKVKRRTLK